MSMGKLNQKVNQGISNVNLTLKIYRPVKYFQM